MSFKFDANKLLKREAEKASNGRDKRFLNYWDLKEGEELTIRLLPDAGDHTYSNGLFIEFESHWIDGEASLCPKSNGRYEKCSICKHGWDHWHNDEKKLSSKWRAKRRYISQCLVVGESPIKLDDNPDGKMVYLINLPKAVRDEVLKQISAGNIENPVNHNLVIKRTISDGQADYGGSYIVMKEKPLPDEVVEAIENSGGLYDLAEMLPAMPDAEQEADLLRRGIETIDNADTSDASDSPRVAKKEETKVKVNASLGGEKKSKGSGGSAADILSSL